MAGCRILGDAAVHKLLIGLSKSEVKVFQNKLETALRQYSVAEERKYQPEAGIINRPSGQKTLFRAFTSPTSVGTKIIVNPAPDKATNTQQPLHGVIVLCDNYGIPIGLINAEEVTGFRTSLSALVAWTWRRQTDSILVFGAGKQCLWHVRLALALRGEEIKSINIVNRNIGRADAVVQQLKEENASRWKSGATIQSLDPSDDQGLQKMLAEADAVFCTVPSEQVLFPASHLNLASRSRAPYISAIGSWQPQMIELDPDLLKHVAKEGNGYYGRGSPEGGVVLVDDRYSALHHTGEVIRSGLKAEQLVELGEILHAKEGQQGNQSQEQQRLNSWLSEGLVVYKSVGVSLTDLATGEAILDMAQQNDMGTLITDL